MDLENTVELVGNFPVKVCHHEFKMIESTLYIFI